MQEDELAEQVERELKERNLRRTQDLTSPDDKVNPLEEIASAIESVGTLFKPTVYRDSYLGANPDFYVKQLSRYMKEFRRGREDMANRVPLKWLNILPETMMGGILGFTYLGDNSMGRRADLTGKTARMVDIHESIHTPDEYETRVLTSWIMEKSRNKYIK